MLHHCGVSLRKEHDAAMLHEMTHNHWLKLKSKLFSLSHVSPHHAQKASTLMVLLFKKNSLLLSSFSGCMIDSFVRITLNRLISLIMYTFINTLILRTFADRLAWLYSEVQLDPSIYDKNKQLLLDTWKTLQQVDYMHESTFCCCCHRSDQWLVSHNVLWSM